MPNAIVYNNHGNHEIQQLTKNLNNKGWSVLFNPGTIDKETARVSFEDKTISISITAHKYLSELLQRIIDLADATDIHVSGTYLYLFVAGEQFRKKDGGHTYTNKTLSVHRITI